MIARQAALFALASLLAAQASAQSLAEAARKERERRQALRGKPTKVLTDDDLKKPNPEDAAAGASAKQATTTTPAEDVRGTLDSIAADRDAEKAAWASRAEDRRVALEEAQQKVDSLSAELERVRLDRDPNAAVLDPSRMQQLEAQQAKLRSQLEAARQALQQAKDAFAALEDEARRKGVPPGWIRE